MFLHDLTPSQQETFFRAAALLVAADGRNEQAEVDLLESARLETLLDEVPPAAGSVDELQSALAALAGSPAAPILGLELAGVVVADGDHDEAELNHLREIAHHLGLANDQVERMLDIATRTVALQREALSLIAES